jgi:hypothetical protein
MIKPEYAKAVSEMSKVSIEAELYSLNYIDKWQRSDYDWRDALEGELNKRKKEEDERS